MRWDSAVWTRLKVCWRMKILVELALLYAVCTTVGYIMSYWNRSFFPTACTDGAMTDKTKYDTMVRIAGTSAYSTYCGDIFANRPRSQGGHRHLRLDTCRDGYRRRHRIVMLACVAASGRDNWPRRLNGLTDWINVLCPALSSLLASTEEIGNDENYTFTWLRLGSDPTQQQFDHILEEIQSRTRGSRALVYKCYNQFFWRFLSRLGYITTCCWNQQQNYCYVKFIDNVQIWSYVFRQ